MRVGVLHDFCVNKGGGDFVILNALGALNETYDVTLITSKPSGFYEASKFFDSEIGNVKIRQVRVSRFFFHPYSIAQMAKKVAKENSYDLFIVSDDVPKCFSNSKVVCYVHYPHAARLKFGEHVVSKYRRSIKGRIQWWAHARIFPSYYPTEQISDKWLLVANSRVTMEHALKTFNLEPIMITSLSPPVASASINMLRKKSHVQKEDLAVCIGWFEPLKGFSDVVNALSLIEDKDRPRLRLIGFEGDKTYLRELIKSIEILGVRSRVELLLNAERNTVVNSILKAKVIVHPAAREHFGIAVVEGMAAGCIPIVRKGFNGPWMEILQEGKYGLGFERVEELALVMEDAFRNYEDFDRDRIVHRALEFDQQNFRDKFLETVERFLGR
jgi:glycosyltransferase involved in cell wall biosynthesis